jgi:hypothetical protein
MNFYKTGFLKHTLAKDSKRCLFCTLVISIGYFLWLRRLYPIPSFYSDSFTWVGAAVSRQPITFRPVGYSKLLIFFHYFSTSDVALIAAQYFINVIVNLFLFLTCTYFFPLKNRYKWLLYLLLVSNPFYLFYSNYISSDAFFNCFTVLWFTLLIWLMYKPTWSLIIAQLTVLAGLFYLRYNAIFFPAISMLALLITRSGLAKKAISIVISFVLVGTIVLITTYQTKAFAGTKTFSAFSGWQLANDALHVLQHDKIDTSKIHDNDVKHVTRFMLHFFDTARQKFPDTSASAVFMWHINSPLKRYMYAFPRTQYSYFKTWNAVGPVYSKFGKEVILQKPFSYIRYFVWPNTKAYFTPALEIYETYMEGRDTLPSIVSYFYRYKSNKIPAHHPAVYAIVFTPMQYFFVAINIIFLGVGSFYLFSGRFKKQPKLFNHVLLCYAVFFTINFFFVVLLAPTVIRYHIFIITLSFPLLLFLIQQLFTPSTNDINSKVAVGIARNITC